MTLKELARMAGVSTASVSLVLNNKPGVGEEKRREILRLLRETGYGEPKAGLNASPGQLLFLKYMHSGQVAEENPGFISSILDAIESECRQLGYLLRIEVRRGQLADVIDQMDMSGLTGLFLLGTELTEDDLPALEKITLPYIVLDNRMPEVPCNAIVMNNHEMVRDAVRYLHRLGHTHIGYLKSSMPIRNFEDRSEAFFKAVQECGMHCGPEDIIELEPVMMGACNGMKRWLSKHKMPPPCLFADNDIIAVGVMRAFSEAGIRIPQDVSIIGFDDIAVSEVHGLTTMHVPTALIGRTAVRVLADTMVLRELNDCKVLIGGTLAERSSCMEKKEKIIS